MVHKPLILQFMNAQNNIRRKTHWLVFLLFLEFGYTLHAQPIKSWDDILLNEVPDDTSNAAKNLRKKELKKLLPASAFNTNEINALVEIERSRKLQNIILKQYAHKAVTAINKNWATNPITPELGKICKDTFNLIMGQYFKVDTLEGPEVGEVPLHGWRLHLDSIKSLTSPPLMSGRVPAKELLLVPVMKPTKLPNGNYDISRKYMSIIVAGIDQNNKIILNSNQKADLYEYLKPCPNNCPLNFSNVFDKEQ